MLALIARNYRRLGGLIVLAETAAEALEVAANSPHVQHGGRIEVRRIEPT